jgi:GT2 family glycosyltransferase
MRASVDAVVVIRRGGEQLEATLAAVRGQTRPVDRLCVVDLSADSTLQTQLDAGVEGMAPVDTVRLPFGTTLADAITDATEALYPGGVIPDSAWMWLLRDDTTPQPSALEWLTLSVEGAPMVKIAGPKQRMTERPSVIREMGETMTRFGERIALAERELDQAQYDRLSDVLGVGEAGMLVHAATLAELEGFDPALSPLDGGLDLCVRARLAGHRVVVLPRAVIDVGQGPADWFSGKKVGPLRQRYLSRRAWLYRRFVYAPAWALLPIIVWMLPWAVIRGLWHSVAKHPDRSIAEITAALWALGKLGDVLSARAVLSRAQAGSWAVVDSLRMGPEDVRKRRAISHESRVAAEEETAFQAPRPGFFPAFPWTILTLAVIAGVTHGRWWGSGVLLGGGVLPLPATLQELWSEAWTVVPRTLSLDAPALPADPFNFVLAILGSLTWWSPTLALTGLLLIAIPLAGASAWWALSHIVSKAWTTSLGAALWAISPVFLMALHDGRVGAVVAHISLPWLVGALLGAHNSWQRVGQASLATLVVVAAAPVLWPLVVIGYLVVGLARARTNGVRVLAGVIPLGLGPALILSAPRFGYWWDSVSGRWWDDWGVLFADPGRPVVHVAGAWWEMAAGWPQSLSEVVSSPLPSWIVLVVAAPLVATAVLSLAVGRPLAGGAFGGLVSLGLVAAVASSGLFSGYENFERVFVWPGSAVSVLVLGLIIGAIATLDRVDFSDVLGNPLGGPAQWLTRGAAGAVAVAALVSVVPFVAAAWSPAAPVVPSSAARTLPAFVAAEAVTTPAVGTLIIREVGTDYQVSLERGAGPTLMNSSSLVRARDVEITQRDEELARLVSTLVRPTSESPAQTLQDYGIRFILLDAPPESPASVALAKRPELVSASVADAGSLWQVPEVTVPPVTTGDPGQNSAFWLALAIAGLFAIPTERRAQPGSRVRDDALPALGEETSDEL